MNVLLCSTVSGTRDGNGDKQDSLADPIMSGRSRHRRTCSSTTAARVSRSSSSRTPEPGHHHRRVAGQTPLFVPQGRQFSIAEDEDEANLSGGALAGGHAGDALFPWVSAHSSMRP